MGKRRRGKNKPLSLCAHTCKRAASRGDTETNANRHMCACVQRTNASSSSSARASLNGAPPEA
eukprot:16339-Eustigmatos_ZCMA.PRE.1